MVLETSTEPGGKPRVGKEEPEMHIAALSEKSEKESERTRKQAASQPLKKEDTAMTDFLNDYDAEDLEQVARAMTLLKAKGKNSYEYLSRPLTRVCPNCGKVFEALGRGRPKRFCSKACRLKYHHQNPNPGNWESTRVALCPVCGKEFMASREYGRVRKYCSRACANKARALIRKGLLKENEDDQ